MAAMGPVAAMDSAACRISLCAICKESNTPITMRNREASIQGKARHSVRAVRSSAGGLRRARSDAPYLALTHSLLCFLFSVTFSTCASAQPPASDKELDGLAQLGTRNIRLHDPSTIVKCKDEFWIFY